MDIATQPDGLKLISQLQRLVGIHIWTLDLGKMVMRVELGHDFRDAKVHEMPVRGLNTLLSAEELRLVAAHWEEAAQKGVAGPALLPFVRADLTKSQVESVCCRMHSGDGDYLIGLFRRPTVAKAASVDAAARKELVLVEYIEAFIDNSPSAIVVADPAGNIISINQECLRFLGKTDRKEAIRQPLVKMMRAVDVGLGDIVAQVFPSAKAMRGRYEATVSRAKQQTLHWRFFPLTLKGNASPPRVFAFDVNAGGAHPA